MHRGGLQLCFPGAVMHHEKLLEDIGKTFLFTWISAHPGVKPLLNRLNL